jgi:hypothetical protein
MTDRYAQIYDSTVRDAFEAYCHQRIDTTGEAVPYDPDAYTADAEWVEHNLSRVHDSLSNGYCGPPQQDCPHPNACPRHERRAGLMSRADNTIHLHLAAADKREAATRRTVAVIEELDRTGAAVTVAGVATTAEVSRSWLYEQPDLLAAALRRSRRREKNSAVATGTAARSSRQSSGLWRSRH